MHCPNCGLESSRDLKFCRGCGLGLEEVARIVGAHDGQKLPAKSRRDRDRQMTRQVAINLFRSIIAIFVGAALAGLNKKRYHNDGLEFLAMVIIIGGVIMAAYSVLSPMWQQWSSSEPRAADPTGPIETVEAAAYKTPRELPEVPASITENTTRELEHERHKRRDGREYAKAAPTV